MARTSRQRKKSTAYHEAGHGVACVVHGHSVATLTIIPGEGSLGHCLHPPVFHYECDTERERRKVARESIIVCYAGWPAQKKFDPMADELGSRLDNDQAFHLSAEFSVFPQRMSSVGDDVHYAFLDRLRNEAYRLVTKHWSAVEALAEELFERKTLNGDTIEAIVRPFMPNR